MPTATRAEAELAAYIEQAIREELGRIGEYYGGNFWVMDLGSVVGMVGIERESDESAELRRMAVDARHRRRGGCTKTSGYRYLASATPAGTSHKQVGGLARYYYEKRL